MTPAAAGGSSYWSEGERGSASSTLGPDICRKSSLSSVMSSLKECRGGTECCSRSSMKSHSRTLFMNYTHTHTQEQQGVVSKASGAACRGQWWAAPTRTLPSELSCFLGRSGSGRVPSGRACRYRHLDPKGQEPRPWSKYLQAFLLQDTGRHQSSRTHRGTRQDLDLGRRQHQDWDQHLTPDLKRSMRWSLSPWSSTQ